MSDWNIFNSNWNNSINKVNTPAKKEDNSMLIPALVSAAATIGTSIYNNYMQKKTNQQNQDYQTNMLKNRLQMTVGDAEKAGLSPLAAVGAAPASVSANAQAPQLDAASLSDMLYSMASLQVERDKLAENKRQFDMTHPNQHDEFGENLQNQVKIAGIQADSSKYSADKSAESSRYVADKSADTAAANLSENKRQFDSNLKQRIYEFGKNIELRNSEFDALYKQNDKKAAADFIVRQQPAMLDEYKSMCSTLGVHVPIKWCDSVDEYNRERKLNDSLLTSFYTKYNEYVKKNPDSKFDSVTDSVSKNINGHVGFGVGDSQNIKETTSEAGEDSRRSSKNKNVFENAGDWLKNGAKEIIKSGLPSFDVNAAAGYSESEMHGYSQSSHLRKVASDLMRECGYQFVMLRATYKD